ncbi:unnamed protein product [Ambrosiozyma monospora]|uniref:Unnamed protein product n=1 Tax=Ambrosiozyma monospora TaxID=43982 RepID=A0ACB5TAZ8_AMBMO|nr:unnamed protein product [Ambrosiozyma monospora]
MLARCEKLNIKVIRVDETKVTTETQYWDSSFTKFNVFKLTQYNRLVFFDSDALVLQTMDELFLMPPSLIYAPANYVRFRSFNEFHMDLTGIVQTWLERDEIVGDIFKRYIRKKGAYIDTYKLYNSLPSMKSSIELLDEYGLDFQLANYIMVVEPNLKIFDSLMKLTQNRADGQYDMDIFNELVNLKHSVNNNVFKSEVNGEYIPFITVLPHKPYALLTGEFKKFEREHDCYLADPEDLILLSYNYPNQFIDLEKRKNLIKFKSEEKKSREDVIVEDNLNENPDLPYWSFQNNKLETNYGWLSNVILEETKLVHFSDHPIPKPWNDVSMLLDLFVNDLNSYCSLLKDPINSEGCTGIQTWRSIYKTYDELLESVMTMST